MVKTAVAALILLASAAAAAQSVYKSVDESGRVVYTDRQPATKGPAAKVKTPPPVSNYDYELALLRRQTERAYSDRLHWEDRSRRPIVVYDPAGVQQAPRPVYRAPAINVRRDPNLPDTPPPSNERQYYYQGR